MARNVLVVSVTLFAAVIAAVTDFGSDRSPAQRDSGEDAYPITPRTDHPPAARPRPAFAFPEIEPGDLRLEGMVLDNSEHPVAGATVTLAGTRETVTEADGSFAFDQIAAGEYMITAEKLDAYAETRDATLTETSEPVTLTLRRGAHLIVHVIDAESGAPIANAEVDATDRVGITDATGTVALRSLDTGSTRVDVVADGRAPRSLFVAADDPELTVERTVELSPGALLSGIVVDETGAPLPRASLNVDTITGNWHGWATADEAGRWTLPSVAAGKHVIMALADSHITPSEVVVETDGVHPRTDIVVRLDRGARISGVVVDRSGAPVAGADVSTGFGHARSDTAGKFVVEGIPPGEYTVSATTRTAGSTETTVKLAQGERVDVKVVLEDGTIAGRVVDRTGAPVGDARVRARHVRTEHVYFAYADDYGTFDFGGMEPGDYKLSITRSDLTYADDGPTQLAKTGERNVRVVLDGAAALTGRVVLDGKPVASYGVVVSTDPDPRFTDPTPVHDASGRFARADIGPGTWAVTIVGRGIAKKTITGVRLLAGKTVDLGDIAVERGRVITGRVVDERGQPIADARVEATAGTFGDDETLERLLRGEVFARSAADGTFELAGVDEGELEMRASHPQRGAAIPRTLAAGESRVRLVVMMTGVLDGTIANYSDIASEVVITDATTGAVIAKADLDRAGTFHLAQLPAGERIVTLRGHADIQSQRLTIRPKARVRVAFTLQRQPITLELDHPGCTQIALRDPTTRTQVASASCKDGRGELVNVSPGRYLACPDSGACTSIDVLTWITTQIFDI